MTRAARLCMLLVLLGSSWLSGQSRDVTRAAMSGTGVIAGRVLDGTTGRPLRRVTVTVSDTTNVMPSRVSVTDEGGKFSVRNLPAGRFAVSANRAPYLPTPYGATRLPRPGAATQGTPISLADGQRLSDIEIKLLRGGVISGVVRDVNGQAAAGAAVSLFYFARSYTTGERTLTSYNGTFGYSTADDRGAYRIFGLPPGDYFVSVGSTSRQEVAPTTDVDVQRASDLIQRPSEIDPASGTAASGLPRRPTVGYAPVFYPGTTTVTDATPVTVEAGQERAGIDLQIQFVPTAHISGRVIGPDGAPFPGVSIRVALVGDSAVPLGDFGFSLLSGGTSDATGRFVLTGVLPGDYMLQARANSPMAGPVSPIAPAALWAQTPVTIRGQDAVADLALQPALTVRGRVSTEGTSPPPDFTKVRLGLMAVVSGPSITMSVPSVTVEASGEFTIQGVTPGRYRLIASLPPGQPGGQAIWTEKSGVLAGRESLDVPVEITGTEDLANAAVVLSDRATELSGTMSDASGRAATDYFIIVFPADKAFWMPQSRRILQTRPAQDGKFIFKNLPPGDYLLAAVTDVEQGQWFDPAFLAQLVDASTKVPLADGEKKVWNISIR